MKNVTSSLGFRLIVASFVVVSVFIFVAGMTVYRISQDAIKVGSMELVSKMAEDVRLLSSRETGIDVVSDVLMSLKIKKSGSVWLMDKNGTLLYHPDPLFREEYIKRGKSLGNVVISLQYASPRESGQGSYKEKLSDIIVKYEEGFGTYQQYGETRVVAFRVLKEQGWLIGLDEPVATAYSELNRIRTYIFYTAVISAVLIMLFTWLAIRIIVKPYYRQVEDLNQRLQASNEQLSRSNIMLEASNRKITSLYKISITMQETLSLEDILDLIVSGAQEVLGVDRINIMLPDRKGSILECRAAVGAGDRPLTGITLPLSSKGGALAAAYKRGQIIRIAPGDHLPPNFRLASPQAEDPFLRSRAFVALPMVVKNKSVGVIAIDNKVSRGPITDDMVNLIQIFANQAAVAVDNARLYEELKRNLEELDTRVDQLSIVNQISNTMQKMVKRKEMLGFILRGIRESMGFDAVMAGLIDAEEDLVRGEVGVGVAEEKVAGMEIPLGDEETLVGLAVGRGVPVNRMTTREIEFAAALSQPMEAAGLKEAAGAPPEGAGMAVAVIPLRVLDDVAGVIALCRTGRNLVITKKEMELLMLFANTAGLAVERANLYEKINGNLESLEITDHVTKLFTFKYGQQRTREAIIRSRESSRPLGVIMIGLDNFKEFNERYGLEAGDHALGEIGHLVKMVLFENDLAFRYGGRLICCLLPGRSLDEARQTGEKVKRLIGDHIFTTVEGMKKPTLTASIGIFVYGHQDDLLSPSELFKKSMAQLHHAEAAGGDQIFSG